jgi:BRCT domain type II-containing protein
MSFWNIFGNMAVSDKGETITRLSDTTSVSSSGVTYTKVGNMTVGSDGSNFTQMGDFSTDGSVRMGNTTTGRGALFADKSDPFNTSGSDDSGW